MAQIAPEPSEAAMQNIELRDVQSASQTEQKDAGDTKPAESAGATTTPVLPIDTKKIGRGEEDDIEEELPPLTFIDFLPQCFGVRVEGSDPTFAEFQSLVEQANQWLRSMPQFSVVKCETVDHKLNPMDYALDPDAVLQHLSSHGKNVYVKGLRLWLMPKVDSSIPVQQLAYITVMPDHVSGSLAGGLGSIVLGTLRMHQEQQLLFPQFDAFSLTMEKLNHHLAQKPLPGRILTVETVPFKAVESDVVEDILNTENTFWSESGKNGRLFLYAVRIFYVVGQPAFEKLGYYDQVPDYSQSPDGMGLRIKFAPFSQTVNRAAIWLQDQHNTKVVNTQSVTYKMERAAGGAGMFKVNPDTPGYTEAPSLVESRYVKILRIFYTKDKKSDSPGLYGSTQMTTRLFVPTKTVAWGKTFETYSKTMQRVISWLSATGTPVLGMETVRYPVSPETSEDAGINDERVDQIVNSNSGQYTLTCIRLYFTKQFTEPPPEVLPQTDEDSWASWGCVIA